MSITPSPQTVSGQSRNETGKFLTGSTMGHVINMTSAASVGLVAIFLVDALNLFYISQLGQKELAAAVGLCAVRRGWGVSDYLTLGRVAYGVMACHDDLERPNGFR